MSLTEITRPTVEPYLHSQRLSYTKVDVGQGSQLNSPNGASHTLPPLISLQSRDQLYNSYHSGLNLELHPLQYSQDNPMAPLSHILRQDHQPSKLMPLHSPSSQFSTGTGVHEFLENGAAPPFPRRQAKKIGQRRDITGPHRQTDLSSSSRLFEQQRSPPVIYREKMSRDVDAPQSSFQGAIGSENTKPIEAPILGARPPSHAFPSTPLRSEGPRLTEGPAHEVRASQHSYPGTTSESKGQIERPVQEAQAPQHTFTGPTLRTQDPGTVERPMQDVMILQRTFSGTRSEGARSMEISGIISDTKLAYAITIHPKIPSLANLFSIEPRHEPKYIISLRQQPLAARACGFGDRDRRAVDPPPILQMMIEDPRATPQEIKTKLRYPYFVVHCELWNADEDHAETAMPELNDRPHQRRLMGTVVASPFVGQDENDIEGCFFCFPDLSCRTSGSYRLRFVLLILDPSNMKPGDRSPFRAMAMSQVFRVFAAKDFPGMLESTRLTKALKAQGCLISVKKGNNRAKSSHARGENEDDDEGDEEEDGESSANPRKRQKK
jgi:Velvet factor